MIANSLIAYGALTAPSKQPIGLRGVWPEHGHFGAGEQVDGTECREGISMGGMALGGQMGKDVPIA